jgi:hypothetical protein
MKTIVYNNINCNYTFDNICLTLTKFWTYEVLPIKKKKIWLSLIAYKNKKPFKLIDNLPFNTCDYTDVVIVLKQILTLKLNKRSKLDKVVFCFHFENKYGWKEYSISVIIFILYYMFLFSSTFILFYTTYKLFNIFDVLNNGSTLEVINQDILPLDVEQKTIKYTNKCVFNIFNDIFNRFYSSYTYYPSCFIETNVRIINEENNFSSLDYIYSKQFYILDKSVKSFMNYYDCNERLKYDLNAIRIEYSYYKKYCLPVI